MSTESPPARKHRETFTLAGISVLGSAVGLSVAFLLFRHLGMTVNIPKQDRSEFVAPTKIPPGTTPQFISGLPSMPNGKTVIVVFQDYQCSPCRANHDSLSKAAKMSPSKLQNTQVVCRNFPLPIHSNARYCADVAEAAREQGKFDRMNDYLFSMAGNVTPEQVKAACIPMGIDWNALDKSIKTSAHEKVAKDIEDATKIGLQYTPTDVILKPGVAPTVTYHLRLD